MGYGSLTAAAQTGRAKPIWKIITTKVLMDLVLTNDPKVNYSGFRKW